MLVGLAAVDYCCHTLHKGPRLRTHLPVQIYGAGLFSGWGKSERFLGQCLAAGGGSRGGAVVVSKYMPWPWRFREPTSLLGALRASVERLGVESLDCYLIHNPLTTLRSLKVHAALRCNRGALWARFFSSWEVASLPCSVAPVHGQCPARCRP